MIDRADKKAVLGSFFGAGFLPVAPGTWGSLAAFVIYLPVRLYGLDEHYLGCLLLSLLFSAASLAVGSRLQDVAGEQDPGWFVLDEMAGVFLALFALADYNLAFAVAAFVMFRFFDALKVGAVGWAEKRLPGAIGVLLDDLVAASFANLTVRGLGLILLRMELTSRIS